MAAGHLCPTRPALPSPGSSPERSPAASSFDQPPTKSWCQSRPHDSPVCQYTRAPLAAFRPRQEIVQSTSRPADNLPIPSGRLSSLVQPSADNLLASGLVLNREEVEWGPVPARAWEWEEERRAGRAVRTLS